MRNILIVLSVLMFSSCFMGDPIKSVHDDVKRATFYMPGIVTYHMHTYLSKGDIENFPYVYLRLRNLVDPSAEDVRFSKVIIKNGKGKEFTILTPPDTHVYKTIYETASDKPEGSSERYSTNLLRFKAEFSDLYLDERQVDALAEVMNGDDIKITFIGYDTIEYKVSDAEIRAVKNIFAKREALINLNTVNNTSAK